MVFFALDTIKLPLAKRQPHKMVKHTQPVRWLLPTNCLSVFDHFMGLALKGLSTSIYFLNPSANCGIRYPSEESLETP